MFGGVLEADCGLIGMEHGRAQALLMSFTSRHHREISFWL